MSEEPSGTDSPQPESAPTSAEPAGSNGPHPQYWLRVHGFPGSLETEVVYYNDFYDPRLGRLPSDPARNLQVGDVIIYFADGPASLYGLARVSGEVQGPLPDPRRGQTWVVPIQREAIIRAVNKAPHAAWMEPPSGWHFLNVARSYTYIRLPEEDGRYYSEQVRARANPRDLAPAAGAQAGAQSPAEVQGEGSAGG